jgi:hypothetical protein
VGGPARKYKKVQWLLKESGLIKPWIFDPTAAVAVDRAINPVHRSTVDRTEGVHPALIRTVRARSNGRGRVHARDSSARAGNRSGMAALRRKIAGAP